MSGSVDAPSRPVRSIASVTFALCVSASARRCSQTSAMAVRTFRNDGRPWRSSSGKYVPAKKGRPSVVRNAVIGQPPLPVIAWTASM